MKIMIISDLYPPFYVGGYELRCKETADEISKRGHDICVLTSRWGLKKPQIEGTVYRLLHFNPISHISNYNRSSDQFRLRRRFNQLQWSIQCRENYRIASTLMNQVKPEVAFFWNMGSIGINPILAAQYIGIPTVFSLGIDWLISLKKQLYQEPDPIKKKVRSILVGLKDFQALDVTHMIAISQALKNIYIENGFPNKDIIVIPRGIPSNRILVDHELNDIHQEGKIRLLFVGRICPEKAPDDAIKAIGILQGHIKDRVIELDIIGTGEEKYLNELKDLIAKLRLEIHVNFLGRVEHSQIFKLYSDHDALLFPSRWEEPLGVVVLEAMARGIPVIATDRGGVSEILMDDLNGLLIPANNPERLAYATSRLFLEKGLAERLRRAALKTIRERFTLEDIIDQITQYLMNRVLLSKRSMNDIEG